VREIDVLLASLAEETLDHIPARHERGGLRFGLGLRDRCRRAACPAAQPFLAPVRSRQKRRGILVPRIEIEDLARQLPDKPPVAPRPGRLDPVEQLVNLALNPLTRHREGSLVIAVARCPPAIHAPAPHRCRTGSDEPRTVDRGPHSQCCLHGDRGAMAVNAETTAVTKSDSLGRRAPCCCSVRLASVCSASRHTLGLDESREPWASHQGRSLSPRPSAGMSLRSGEDGRLVAGEDSPASFPLRPSPQLAWDRARSAACLS
jgi:hypothetical protein